MENCRLHSTNIYLDIGHDPHCFLQLHHLAAGDGRGLHCHLLLCGLEVHRVSAWNPVRPWRASMLLILGEYSRKRISFLPGSQYCWMTLWYASYLSTTRRNGVFFGSLVLSSHWCYHSPSYWSSSLCSASPSHAMCGAVLTSKYQNKRNSLKSEYPQGVPQKLSTSSRVRLKV